jgi:glycosyltransferase involved in cell wall biosynthesis
MMKVSVVVVARNEAGFIGNLLDALSCQSFKEFEVVIIDNASTDGTKRAIDSFKDNRIKYFYEPSRCGIASLRNLGVKKASGTYIFFTDADCMPTNYWLEEGLKILETEGCIGVEGKTYYESQQEVTVSDYNTHQFIAGEFMSCNIAYRSDILEKLNYFDPFFKNGHEDRDLAFRALKLGKIYFSPHMLVSHQKKRLTIRAVLNRAKRSEDSVYFIKKHGFHSRLKINILYPERLLIIFCPFILIFAVSYRSVYDFILGFFKYIFYIYERLIIWKAAIKNRIFII